MKKFYVSTVLALMLLITSCSEGTDSGPVPEEDPVVLFPYTFRQAKVMLSMVRMEQ